MMLSKAVSVYFTTLVGLTAVGLFENVECGYASPKLKNSTIPYLSIRRRLLLEKNITKSEIPCKFQWTNKQEILKERLANREAKFLRFKVPVTRYNNALAGYDHYTGFLKWVSVLESHEEMLRYPHNFEVISLRTMSLIVQNFNDKSYYNGTCIPEGCKCSIGKNELEGILPDISAQLKDKIKFVYLCLPHRFSGLDFFIKERPAFLFSYLRFVTSFYTKWMNVTNYKCYKDNEVKTFYLHENYIYITFLAWIIWLYSPLLIHFFPCNQVSPSSNMLPSYIKPVHLGTCFKSFIVWLSIKPIVRSIIITSSLIIGIMNYYLSGIFLDYFFEAYLIDSIVLLLSFSSVFLCSSSTYIGPQLPSAFPVIPFIYKWDFPEGLIKETKLIGFQRLSHVMLERMYLFSDGRFWYKALKKSFGLFLPDSDVLPTRPSCKQTICCILLFSAKLFFSVIIIGIPCFLGSIIIFVTYFFVPFPYFLKELFISIWKPIISLFRRDRSGIWLRIFLCPVLFLAGLILTNLLFHVIFALFFLSHFFSEVIIYTYMGAIIASNLFFGYLTVVGAATFAIYSMIHGLHEEYDQIMKATIDVVTAQSKLEIKERIGSNGNDYRLLLNRVNSSAFDIWVCRREETRPQMLAYKPYHKILECNGSTTNISKKNYFSVVEKLKPIRREVLLVITKILFMIVFIWIAIKTKIVYYYKEKMDPSIFALVTILAINMIPAVLQFLANGNNYGVKFQEKLNEEIRGVLDECIKELLEEQLEEQSAEQSAELSAEELEELL